MAEIDEKLRITVTGQFVGKNVPVRGDTADVRFSIHGAKPGEGHFTLRLNREQAEKLDLSCAFEAHLVIGPRR